MTEPNPAVPAARASFPWREYLVASPPAHRRRLAAATLALVLVIGIIDYHIGPEISLQVFYIIPVCLAVASVGWRFGLLTAVLSVGSALLGEATEGQFARPISPWVNAAFALGTYFAVVGLFRCVLILQGELEERVRQRTAALRSVIKERERLELAILEIGERERRDIGHDLHDGLGQHLTGTALAAQVVVELLRESDRPREEAAVQKLIDHIEEAIDKTRRIAKGLLLAEIQSGALVTALQDLCAGVSEEFRVACTFRAKAKEEINLRDDATATHLFRIASQAVHNAIRHGRARNISIALEGDASGQRLTIADDGTGLPPAELRGRGLGLSIMAHRAEIIGWNFEIGPRPEGGTLLTCRHQPLPA